MLKSPQVIALALLVCTCGCGDSEQQAATSRPVNELTPIEQNRDEVDKLLALPYAGYVDVDEDDEQGVGVVLYDAEKSYPGYNLYCVHERCRAELMDAEGRVLRSWSRPSGYSWENVELLPNGDLLVVGKDPLPEGAEGSGSGRPRYLIRFDWDGDVLWETGIAAHHDVEVTPRNQILTLTFQRRPAPEIHPRAVIKDVGLVLLDHDGNVLQSLSVFDVLRKQPEVFPLVRLQRLRRDGNEGKSFDLFHCNSVEWTHFKQLEGRHPIYGPGCVLVCFRHQHRIAVFDWDERKVLWAWGEGELSGPHDAQYLANGNILVYDNGVKRKYSRVLELDPLSEKIVWQYQATTPDEFFSLTKGSNQRLPNGNTLIANSDNGEAFEVTREGEIVWRFICSYKNDEGQRATIVRIKRYERGFIDSLPTAE